MSFAEIFAAVFGLLLVGALVTAARGLSWRAAGYIAIIFAAAATAAVWKLAAQVFISGPIEINQRLVTFRILNASLNFHIDALSAIFLVVVPLVSLCAMLYSIEYMRRRHYEESPSRYYPFTLLLLASIIGVVTVSDLFFFFIFWELMTLTSYFLVVFDRESEKKVQAGIPYFVATHIATALMYIAGIIIYSRCGSFAFSDIKLCISEIMHLTPWLGHIILALFLLGFATKAGIFPLGGWLPLAYPSAPSPATAAFSGSMTKLGIYGIVRVFFEFLPVSNSNSSWGMIIATLGAISIFIGTITALKQDDYKRLLSFHIIGQIGYILLGVGIGVAFVGISPSIAAIGLIAGLFHLVNNAIYKSLLFLNVGAVEYWTDERNLNKVGGLGVLMPLTFTATVIASLSIAGVPPFSGFASKWLIYHAAIHGGLTMPLLLILGLVGIFISTVTLASFMKMLGVLFLGKFHTDGEQIKGEVPLTMRLPQYLLALLCILFGVVPVLPLVFLYKAAASALPAESMPAFTGLFGHNASGLMLSFGGSTVGIWNPALAVAALAICAAISYIIFKAGAAPSREVDSWYCGEEFAPELVRFRSHGFVLPFKQSFDKMYPAIKIPKLQVPGFLQKLFDFDSWLYNPVISAGSRLSEKFSRTHAGIPQMYMLWQVVGAVLVIGALFLIVR